MNVFISRSSDVWLDGITTTDAPSELWEIPDERPPQATGKYCKITHKITFFVHCVNCNSEQRVLQF